jgi:hypothetical protein
MIYGIAHWTCTRPGPSSVHPTNPLPDVGLGSVQMFMPEKAPASFVYGTTQEHVGFDPQRGGMGAQE